MMNLVVFRWVVVFELIFHLGILAGFFFCGETYKGCGSLSDEWGAIFFGLSLVIIASCSIFSNLGVNLRSFIYASLATIFISVFYCALFPLNGFTGDYIIKMAIITQFAVTYCVLFIKSCNPAFNRWNFGRWKLNFGICLVPFGIFLIYSVIQLWNMDTRQLSDMVVDEMVRGCVGGAVFFAILGAFIGNTFVMCNSYGCYIETDSEPICAIASATREHLDE